MFRNGVGFHIHGGNFYDVQSGDVNLHTHQHLTIQDQSLNHMALQAAPPSSATLALENDREADGSGRELSGVVRQRRRTAGPVPYDMSSRRHLSAGASSDDANPLLPSSSSLPSSSPWPSLIFSEPRPESNHPAISTSTSPPSAGPSLTLAGPQYPNRHADGTAGHAEFSTLPNPDRPSSHPSDHVLSSFKSTRGNPEPSSSCDSPGHLLSYPALSHGARAESVEGGTFITAQNVNHIHRHGETGINLLHRAAVLEALYNSAESFPQPKCHPETRTTILDDLHSWAISHESASSIFWLYGPAGAGKSAIMQTLCQKLDHNGHLAGSFFFKRGHATRGNANMFFVTLAYQLALQNTSFLAAVSKSVEDDRSVVGRSMEIQLQKLIVEPCQSLQSRPPTIQPSHSVGNFKPPIFLIDGLDECKGQNIQQELLRLINDAVLHKPRMLRILIASRPEPHIRETFEGPSAKPLSRNLTIERAFADVEKYLQDEFARIHRDHRDTMGRIPTPWPPQNILDLLIEKSSDYFIYASTVIKFVDDKDFRPTERLADVVHWQNLPTDSDQPFEALDQLYTQIL
ncbi:hypothetical protein DFH08DRAFT_739086, partial [Mycena albidolilacea]